MRQAIERRSENGDRRGDGEGFTNAEYDVGHGVEMSRSVNHRKASSCNGISDFAGSILRNDGLPVLSNTKEIHV